MDSNQVFISVENLAPDNGTRLTPVWIGLHNGDFDTYDRGRPSSPGLERIAEDGNADVFSQEFDLSGFGETQGLVAGAAGPIQPGEQTGEVFTVADTTQGQFFNYAAMILPSNDFFIANGNPTAHQIFDDEGNFIGADFIVSGASVLDAGTEVNDEIPENTAFFGQSAPDTGVVENGVIQSATGFIEGGNILSTDTFSEADFTTPDYEVARIRVLNAITGNGRDDVIVGSSADDYIAGASGNDTLTGRLGNDILLGGGGDDRLAGRSGNDELLGQSGDDTLAGGSGDDFLSGGTGRNILRGGEGDDLYELDRSGLAIIQGFEAGDRLLLGSGLQFDDLSIEQQRQNTLISAGEETIAIFRQTNISQINPAIFQ